MVILFDIKLLRSTRLDLTLIVTKEKQASSFNYSLIFKSINLFQLQLYGRTIYGLGKDTKPKIHVKDLCNFMYKFKKQNVKVIIRLPLCYTGVEVFLLELVNICQSKVSNMNF